MRFSNELMSDPNVQKNKINTLKRSDRNSWAERIEIPIRKICPYPISYDVTCNQPTNFTEFTYTEIAGGMYLQTHSIDINTRIMQLASEEESDDDSTHDKLKSLIKDKYVLKGEIPNKFKNIKKVIFMPGSNLLPIASSDIVSRICGEDEEIMVKPHPLTNDEFSKMISSNCGGWNRIISPDLSGLYFLQNAEKIYVTTCSEMATLAIILGKEIENISAYKFESTGVYYPVSRILFSAKDPLKKLINMVNCKWSGLLFPWQTDYIERAQAFYDKSIELKKIYRPLHGPINFPHSPPRDTRPKNAEQNKKEQHPNAPPFNKKIEYKT